MVDAIDTCPIKSVEQSHYDSQSERIKIDEHECMT